MWYLDYYDYPTYNWETESNMEGWETHPVPRSAYSAVRSGVAIGTLMGQKVPFKILPPLGPGWQRDHRLVAVSQSDRFAMGLCSCGKVFIDGFFGWRDYQKKCELVDWEGVIALATGPDDCLGLRKDGRVMSFSCHESAHKVIQSWRNVVQVSVGANIYLGLRKNGTVLAYGGMEEAISSWTNIVQVSAGDNFALGVRCDGTVAHAGYWLDVNDWTDIVQVSAGAYHCVGLRRDGTVVVAASEEFYECMTDVECLDVEDWHDVVQVCAGGTLTAARLKDGRVLVARNGYKEDNPFKPYERSWRSDPALRDYFEDSGYTSVEFRDAVQISVNRHHEGSDEVLALDSEGRAIMCDACEGYIWDNW